MAGYLLTRQSIWVVSTDPVHGQVNAGKERKRKAGGGAGAHVYLENGPSSPAEASSHQRLTGSDLKPSPHPHSSADLPLLSPLKAKTPGQCQDRRQLLRGPGVSSLLISPPWSAAPLAILECLVEGSGLALRRATLLGCSCWPSHSQFGHFPSAVATGRPCGEPSPRRLQPPTVLPSSHLPLPRADPWAESSHEQDTVRYAETGQEVMGENPHGTD